MLPDYRINPFATYPMSDRTIAAHRSRLDVFWDWCANHKIGDPRLVTLELLQQFVTEGSHRWAPSTVKKYAFSVLEWLRHLGIALDAKRLRYPKAAVDRSRHKCLTVGEQRDLFAAARGEHWECLLWPARYLGLRIKEAFLLRWADLDFERNVAHVTHVKSKASRTIPMPAQLRAFLANLKRRPWGHVRPENYVYYEYKRVAACRHAWRAVRPDDYPQPEAIHEIAWGWHNLRRTYATELALAGMNPFRLSEYLGHESITTTLKYVRLCPDVAEVDALISLPWADPSYHPRVVKPEPVRGFYDPTKANDEWEGFEYLLEPEEDEDGEAA